MSRKSNCIDTNKLIVTGQVNIVGPVNIKQSGGCGLGVVFDTPVTFLNDVTGLPEPEAPEIPEMSTNCIVDQDTQVCALDLGGEAGGPSHILMEVDGNELFRLKDNGALQHGTSATASGINSFVSGGPHIGEGPVGPPSATGDWCQAFGSGTLASGNGSHAEGLQSQATNVAAHTEGILTISSGLGSHAEGQETVASGDNSHAEGNITEAQGAGSHAEGQESTASANYSHAEGILTTSSGLSSHAEGQQTFSSGDWSHAEGLLTTASGSYSHAEGWITTAQGPGSHAEGHHTLASGNSSHVGGYSDIPSGIVSSGRGSFAQGYRSTTGGEIRAFDDGGFAGGVSTGGIGIRTTGSGMAWGTCSTGVSPTNITAGGDGSLAMGYVSNNGQITANGRGCHAHGHANGSGQFNMFQPVTNSTINAGAGGITGGGCHAGGYAENGGRITVTGWGSFGHGYVNGGVGSTGNNAIIVGGSNSFCFGPGASDLNNENCFVWSDSTAGDNTEPVTRATDDKQFVIRARGPRIAGPLGYPDHQFQGNHFTLGQGSYEFGGGVTIFNALSLQGAPVSTATSAFGGPFGGDCSWTFCDYSDQVPGNALSPTPPDMYSGGRRSAWAFNNVPKNIQDAINRLAAAVYNLQGGYIL